MTVLEPTTRNPRPETTVPHNPVVARTWRLAVRQGRLLLTGLYGFPWPDPVLEARCLRKDPARGDLLGPGRMVDRYHPVVPDPSCTCGIYGSDDPDRRWSRRPLFVSEPIVNGFIELSGRIVAGGPGVYRARRATVRGPLRIILPRPKLRPRPRPSTDRIVVTDGRPTLSRSARRGTPAADWLRDAREELARLYQTEAI